MARTKAVEKDTKKEVKAEVKQEPVITKKLYRFKKLQGKFHYKDEKGNRCVVRPGEFYTAPRDAFEGDPTWMRMDDEPVPVVEKVKLPKGALKKILVGDNTFDVVRISDGGKVNDEPLSEKAANEMVNASLADD